MSRRYKNYKIAANRFFDQEGGKKEFKPGDLVRVYDGQDAEGHRHFRKIGLIVGTVRKPTEFMEFFTYRVLVENTISNIHEVWIRELEEKNEITK
jgi:hypothetical protein